MYTYVYMCIYYVFLASEAFAPLQCWSEGALQMGENALQRLGVGKPPWMTDEVYRDILFQDAADEEPGFAARHRMPPGLAVEPAVLLARPEEVFV